MLKADKKLELPVEFKLGLLTVLDEFRITGVVVIRFMRSLSSPFFGSSNKPKILKY